MVAPPWYELPPTAYGGIESVCADLVEQLVARGTEVTLIGVGRNGTSARFVSTWDEPQSELLAQAMPEVTHAAALPDIIAGLDVDLVHDHSEAGPLVARCTQVPTVVTVHGAVTGRRLTYLRRLGTSVKMVAVSQAQCRLAPDLNWIGAVHNAVRVSDFPFRAEKDDFVLLLGRACPDKGVTEAIAAANEAGARLVIAAKCLEPSERDYFEREVKPLLGGNIEWLGEVNREVKMELLSRAKCLLFPIRWEEPFGMVMIEAMSCGTPVVALRRGSVPEVVTHGRTGFVCDDVTELAPALHRVGELSPHHCREEMLRRFDVETMTASYERIYRAVAEPRRPRGGAVVPLQSKRAAGLRYRR